MYVLASKGKWSQPFFREELASNDEPLANDKPMDAKLSQSVPTKPLALPGKSKLSEEIKNTKTRRGYGQKNKRRKRTNQINLSLIGTNSAGLTSKKESFYSIINKYKPSTLTTQETKHNKAGLLKIPGYQTFEKVRN